MRTAWLGLALALFPLSAGAAGHLGWFDYGNQDLSYDCANPVETVLVASLQAPAGIDSLFAVDLLVEFCTDPNVLPEWWRVDDPQGCRANALDVSADFSTGPSTYPDPWGGQASVTWSFTYPSVNLIRAAVDVRVDIDPALAVGLQPGQEYYLAKLIFSPPTGTCPAGCEYGACFVLNNYIYLHHAGGTTAVPMSSYESYARWNGGVFDCPFIISVEDQSWGRIKAVYR